MKKAFTLIELLVVIAIIAILAAILFPVFAQAKVAAKKASAISNQKQLGMGFMMYLSDNDDIYPRRTGCEQFSSINPALRDASLNTGGNAGCSGRFYNSMSWQTWQKYIMPYVKNTELFFHPLREKDQVQWDQNGQLLNSFVVNLALIGAANATTDSVPWTGGSQTGIPNTSATMLLMEMPNTYAVPFVLQSGSGSGGRETIYPLAIKEYWQRILFKVTGTNNCGTTGDVDPVGAPGGGVTVGFADGSAKFLPAAKIIANSLPAQQYIGTTYPFGAFSSNCRRTTNVLAYTGGLNPPDTSLNAPFWGLGQ